MSEVSKIYVGPYSSFTGNSRMLVKCGVRNIAVIQYKNAIYAIDNACYHHGGPLLNGDIEDMGNHPCIICPWHSYRISLDSGEGLYVGIDMNKGTRKPVESIKSKGCKQRTHKVVIENGEVYVLVDTSGPPIESDNYANMKLANQEKASAAPKQRMPPSLGLHSELRSGQVFQKMNHQPLNPLSTSPRSSVFLRESAKDHCVVSCYKSVPVCLNVKEFFFKCVAGSLQRFSEPGEFVELELPIQDSTGNKLIRKWTICETKTDESFFTLLVKAYPEREKGGSAWLHQYSLHSPLRVVQIGGTFTLNDHQHRIKALQGNVLYLTAGIGITSAFACVNAHFNDPISLQFSRDKLNILHLHVDREMKSIAKLDTLTDIAKRFPPQFGVQNYQLCCFLTKQVPKEGAKHFSGDGFVLGRRITGKDVVEKTENFFGEGVPFLSFVCGPSEFVNDCTSYLLSAGAAEADILTDDY